MKYEVFDVFLSWSFWMIEDCFSPTCVIYIHIECECKICLLYMRSMGQYMCNGLHNVPPKLLSIQNHKVQSYLEMGSL